MYTTGRAADICLAKPMYTTDVIIPQTVQDPCGSGLKGVYRCSINWKKMIFGRRAKKTVSKQARGSGSDEHDNSLSVWTALSKCNKEPELYRTVVYIAQQKLPTRLSIIHTATVYSRVYSLIQLRRTTVVYIIAFAIN